MTRRTCLTLVWKLWIYSNTRPAMILIRCSVCQIQDIFLEQASNVFTWTFLVFPRIYVGRLPKWPQHIWESACLREETQNGFWQHLQLICLVVLTLSAPSDNPFVTSALELKWEQTSRMTFLRGQPESVYWVSVRKKDERPNVFSGTN